MDGSATRRDLDQRWQDPEPPARGGRDRFHVAINMEENGRWALIRGQPRELGHVAGASALRRTVECAPALGITTLTLYAFSSDNWRRPQCEVDHLMRLFQVRLVSECDHLAERGVRFNVTSLRNFNVLRCRRLCRRAVCIFFGDLLPRHALLFEPREVFL
jgi:undecaprenyl pyrophosphate synthase